MDILNRYIVWMDELPLIVKIIFALPGLDGIFYGLYRLFFGIVNNNMVSVVLGVIWLVVGTWILWVLDIVFLALYGRVLMP